MSSFPSRKLEIWESSRAKELSPINGAFCINVIDTIMVRQTLEFLFERRGYQISGLIGGFLKGMNYYNPENNILLWYKSFNDYNELFNFDLNELIDAMRQLELHTDINLTYSQITYMADVGTGPNIPLLVINRVPFNRGVAFEIEERGMVSQSIQLGDFQLSDKVSVSLQHYSAGMGLLAGEDGLTGLIDAAFMQFYLSVEALLGIYKKAEINDIGKELYGSRFTDELSNIIHHVYKARNSFFGHASPNFIKGHFDNETAFNIAKQTLIARWVSRELMAIELKRPLVKREFRLYPSPDRSVSFNGELHLLRTEFKLPRK